MDSKNENQLVELKDLFSFVPEAQKLRSFIPSQFILTGLPLRDIKNNVFERHYNNITLSLKSINKVPYGLYGRLLLSLLTTHAVMQKNKNDGEIVLEYDSVSSLLDELKLPRQRGKAVKEQLEYFFGCSFIYEEKIREKISASLFPELSDMGKDFQKVVHSTGKISFLDAMQYTDIEVDGNAQKNIGIKIIMNEKFVKLCQKHSVPIDYTVYKDITSPLGKDLYAWFVYRNNSLKDNPIFVSREHLVRQFMPVKGTNENQINVNYFYIKEQIQLIKQKYYKALRIEIQDDGVVLYKSPSVMKSNDTRYVLLTAADI